MLRPVTHPKATAELIDTAEYYHLQQDGLGDEFDAAVTNAVADIQWAPNAWPKFPGWDRLPVVRSRKVAVFPYRVVYFLRDEELVIVAFAHESRRPGYWEGRLDD